MRKEQKTKIIKNFFYSVKKIYSIDKWYIINKFIMAILASITTIMYAYILKTAIQALEEGQEFKEMVINVLTVILIIIPPLLYNRIMDRWSYYSDRRIYALLHLEKSLRTLDMDYELLERPKSQDILENASRRLYSYGSVMGLVNRGFAMIRSSLTFLIACGVLLTVNGWLIIIISILAIFKLFLENTSRIKEKKEYEDKTPPFWRRVNYANTVATNLDIGKDLRVYDMKAFINHEHEKASQEITNLNKKNKIRIVKFESVIAFISLLDRAFLYVFLIYEVLNNGMLIATFSFMISAVRTMINSLNNILKQNSYMLGCSLEADDYRRLMGMNLICTDDSLQTVTEVEEIEFKDVYYSYYMQEGYAIESVSFKLKKGEKLALIGYNGAGKTTIVKLLTGLYHPTKGNIYINGIDINNIKRESLSKIISPVFQETVLYALSLSENIAMVQNQIIDYEKIHSAIKIVDLKEKVDSLTDKEKTMLTRDFDELGINLSGGEGQKLSLARAIYKDASLYILDEPTSAMDAFSEYNMYNNFSNITKDKATIFISHRLSSTKFCDKIIVLANGKILEEGTHEGLMQQESEYKKLFSMQADYYLGGEENEKAK